MQMVILAGGLGTRLGALTADIPKVMVPVFGRPFLAYQLELLRGQGVQRVVLCIGHYGEQVRDYFGDGSAFGVRISYSDEGETLLGTGGALKLAAPLLEDEFFLMWGDSYLLLDYRDVWQHHRAGGYPATMVVYRNHNLDERSNVILADGRVACYDKWHPRPEMTCVDNGLSVLSRSLLERVPAGQVFAIEEIYRQLAEEGNMGAYETPQRFYEIGSVSGLRLFSELVAEK